MEMGKPGRPPLTPDDWARAAFGAVARGGVDAVAVEPIAVELGATKGSFYWHFKNRDALIDAALDEWEQRLTDAVIRDLERETDPAQRLKKLLASSFTLRPLERAAEIALLANPDHPAVRRRMHHVTQRRIDWMAQQLEALGRPPADALDRATLLSCIYVGYLQTTHVAPNVISEDAQRRRRLVELAFANIIAGDPATVSPPRLFHVALGGEWREALANGTAYRRSTLGKTLDEVGFIHCSFAGQWQNVVDLFYRDQADVVLLEIDPSKVPSEIRLETVEGGSETFPHIYGALPPDAVVATRRLGS
jgi:uncharacterized protein (DUF952 family)/AcrR family transcriptional regulator